MCGVTQKVRKSNKRCRIAKCNFTYFLKLRSLCYHKDGKGKDRYNRTSPKDPLTACPLVPTMYASKTKALPPVYPYTYQGLPLALPVASLICSPSIRAACKKTVNGLQKHYPFPISYCQHHLSSHPALLYYTHSPVILLHIQIFIPPRFPMTLLSDVGVR